MFRNKIPFGEIPIKNIEKLQYKKVINYKWRSNIYERRDLYE
ncbi:hypothetical protein BC30090_2180 [Bacillus cereus]|nr:hypothetical protein bcere0001_21350 [Bacillus cereus m1293]BCD23283.1 hypothetical protein BC30090_2180 [Bacillus cereus]GCF69398.1 hypothetical protein BC2903_32170 [Bacillus cereus]